MTTTISTTTVQYGGRWSYGQNDREKIKEKKRTVGTNVLSNKRPVFDLLANAAVMYVCMFAYIACFEN